MCLTLEVCGRHVGVLAMQHRSEYFQIFDHCIIKGTQVMGMIAFMCYISDIVLPSILYIFASLMKIVTKVQ